MPYATSGQNTFRLDLTITPQSNMYRTKSQVLRYEIIV